MFFAKRFLVLAVYYTLTQVSSFVVKARPSSSSSQQQQQQQPQIPLLVSPPHRWAPLRLVANRHKMNAKARKGLATTYRDKEEGDEDNMNPSKYTPYDDNAVDDDDDDDDGDDFYCEILDDRGCRALEDRSTNDQEQDTRYIRVEKGPNDDIANIQTRRDVINEIDRIRQIQETAGRSDLYARSWEETGLPSRPVVNGDGKMMISVMQFNMLAEGLSAGSVPTPFAKMETESSLNAKKAKTAQGSKNETEFGGFSQIQSPEVCLDFTLRRWRLVEVMIQEYMSNCCNDGFTKQCDESALLDIIGLQEVDRYHGFFAPILKLFGYEGRFTPKPLAPGVRFGWYSDGCALFWKSSVFTLVSERYHQYEVGNQILLLVTLRHVISQKLVVVAVTHLKAQMNPTNEQIRCAQAEQLLRHITEAVELAAQLQPSKSGTTMDIPILILGDFNADPPNRMAPGLESSVGKVIHHRVHTTPIGSAYPVDPPKPGFYTTWKTRGSDEVMRIIDYIFYGGLTCKSLLQVPNGDDLEPGRLPGLRYPSDHMMIAARFEF